MNESTLRPRILGGGGELVLLAVEEAVRRAFVGDDLVLDARIGERLLEGCVVLGRDVLVGAGLERKDRSLQLSGALDRPRCPVAPFARPAVETDRACEPVTARRREPGVPAAEAEAEREDRRRRPCERRYSTAAPTSACTPSGVVWPTCSM